MHAPYSITGRGAIIMLARNSVIHTSGRQGRWRNAKRNTELTEETVTVMKFTFIVLMTNIHKTKKSITE